MKLLIGECHYGIRPPGCIFAANNGRNSNIIHGLSRDGRRHGDPGVAEGRDDLLGEAVEVCELDRERGADIRLKRYAVVKITSARQIPPPPFVVVFAR